MIQYTYKKFSNKELNEININCHKLCYNTIQMKQTKSQIHSPTKKEEQEKEPVQEQVILTKKPKKQRISSAAGASILSTSYTVHCDAASGSVPFHTYEVGVDEAGRGPLFGRVYTAAVILPPAGEGSSTDFDFSLLKDSKKFHSDKKIREASDYIKEHAVAWAITYEESEVIDRLNIRRATLQCMRNSINTAIEGHIQSMEHRNRDKPTISDYLLLIDGNDFIPLGNYNKETDEIDTYTHVCVEGGDNTYACIAAASILAKVARDDYIEKLCDQHPILDEMYSLRGNKGYGAKKHIDGIREHGITQWHRRSYGICKEFA
jgi:ribonuclease HII